MILFPNCKINIGLQVLQKRGDGFHDLETVFFPLPLRDALEIIHQTEDTGNDVQLSLTGITLSDPPEQNICVKGYRLLKRDFPSLPPVSIHLHKAIPIGAGLGGGSADGAFTLLLLNRKFNLGIGEEKLIEYALQLGSDCPFFIRNTPCYAWGRGEKMDPLPLDLSPYSITVVNPRIHINTGWAFSQLKPQSSRPSIREEIQKDITSWKDVLVNDFEEVIFEACPEVARIKEAIYKEGAVYASMSGSGSTVYGIFPKEVLPQLLFPEHYFVQHLSLPGGAGH